MDRFYEMLDSRTHWVNLIFSIIGAGELYLPVLRPVLGESTFVVLFFACSASNHILRELTRAKAAK